MLAVLAQLSGENADASSHQATEQASVNSPWPAIRRRLGFSSRNDSDMDPLLFSQDAFCLSHVMPDRLNASKLLSSTSRLVSRARCVALRKVAGSSRCCIHPLAPAVTLIPILRSSYPIKVLIRRNTWPASKEKLCEWWRLACSCQRN